MSQIRSFDQFREQIAKVVTNWERQFNRNDVTKINLALLENIYVDYFGSKTAIKYLGSIKKGSEGEFYFIPFVSKMLQQIFQAMINYGLQWKLILQKDAIMIALPIITTNKKNQIVKEWKLSAENCHVEVRKLRHTFLDYWKKEAKLDKAELIQTQQQIQKIVDETKTKINNLFKTKVDTLLKV